VTASTPEDEQFKLRDSSSYDALAASYDHFTEMFSGPLATRIVELAAVCPTDHVLDVATGSGIVAFQAARTTGTGGKVVGVDLSEGMLATARRKARKAQLEVTFVKGDAEGLEFPDMSFDVVLSLFGLFHFPHPETAVAQMFRVLRPNGRMVIGVGSPPPMFSMVQLTHYLSRVPELIERLRGRWLSAPGFLDRLVMKRLPSCGQPETSALTRSGRRPCSFLPAMIRAAGFEQTEQTWEGYLGELESPEAFWELQAVYSTLARKRVADAPSEPAKALKEEFFHVCRAVQRRKGRLTYRYGALFVAARRPVVVRSL
jgi:ubiquinone/menaquinone biosynthesis C-methylase UbiE